MNFFLEMYGMIFILFVIFKRGGGGCRAPPKAQFTVMPISSVIKVYKKLNTPNNIQEEKISETQISFFLLW